MTQFSNKFKKPCFQPIFGEKEFSWKIQLCHAQLHLGFQHHAKIQKKLTIQFKENARTDGRTQGRTDPILQDTSGYRRGSNKELETHISFINNIDITNEKSNKKSNSSPKEWAELRNLMNQPDKRGVVTVLSKNHYRAMIYEHLSNQNKYQKLDKNFDRTIMKKF